MIVHRRRGRAGPGPRTVGLLTAALALGCASLGSLVIATAHRAEEPARSDRVASTPLVELRMAPASFARLAAWRDEALAARQIRPEHKQFVDVSIGLDGVFTPARARLKGDLLDHLQGERWSFRVRMKDGTAFLGMTEFSLQAPQRRGDLDEFAILRALERERLIGHRYQLVRLRLDGVDLAFYALEEHFGDVQLEAARRRAGPILKFDETLWWDAHVRDPNDQRDTMFGAGEFHSLPIESIEPARVAADPEYAAMYASAYALLEGWRRGELATHEAFDLPALAKALAVSDLFGAHHGLTARQLRFYYDPLIGRLALVLYDTGAGTSLDRPIGLSTRDNILARRGGLYSLPVDLWFADEALWPHYVEALAEVSDPRWLERFRREVGPELALLATTLRDQREGYVFDWTFLDGNAALLREILEPAALVRGWAEGPGGPEVANLHALPVEVIGARSADGAEVSLEPALWLAPRRAATPLGYDRLPVPAGFVPAELVTRVQGTQRTLVEAVRPGDRFGAVVARDDPNPAAAERFRQSPILEVDEGARVVRFLPGDHLGAVALVIPPGWSVIIPPGTRLDLAEGAALISRSPIVGVGTRAAPIEVVSSGGAGQGLAVLQAPGTSRFRFATFRGLRPTAGPGFVHSGALTFYESDVTFEDCLFEENLAGDDLVNLVRSDFRIERSVFRGAAGDALDVDFGSGVLRDVDVEGAHNDALDLSGSEVTLERIRAVEVGDKALSAGEHSQVAVDGFVVVGATVGIAAKDLSVVTGTHIALEGCEIGLTAFRKKPELGPASLTLDEVSFVRVRRQTVRELGSTLSVAGRAEPREELLVGHLIEQLVVP